MANLIREGWSIEWVDAKTYKSLHDGCPKCGSKNLCHFPDYSHIPTEDGNSVSMQTQECWNCKTFIVDITKKKDG